MLTLSKAYTKYCIHWALHHPKIHYLPLTASLSSLGGPCCTQFYTFPRLLIYQWTESQLPSCLLLDLPLPDYQPPCNYSISIHHGLYVHHQTCLITLSKFAQSWPFRASPYSHNSGLKVHVSVNSISVSKCISYSLDHSLEVVWLCSQKSLNNSFEVHHSVLSISGSKYIMKLTRS